MKPDNLENKLFDYHLKIVMRDGFVEKGTDGRYRLTNKARRISRDATTQKFSVLDRALSTLFMAVRRDDEWLLYRRDAHPLFGLVGLPHALPEADSDILTTAHEILREKSGLSTTFHVHGHGYLRVYEPNLESFTHFTLLAADTVEGELKPEAENFFWAKNPDLTAPEIMPTMPYLIKLAEGESGKFIDATIQATRS